MGGNKLLVLLLNTVAKPDTAPLSQQGNPKGKPLNVVVVSGSVRTRENLLSDL